MSDIFSTRNGSVSYGESTGKQKLVCIRGAVFHPPFAGNDEKNCACLWIQYPPPPRRPVRARTWSLVWTQVMRVRPPPKRPKPAPRLEKGVQERDAEQQGPEFSRPGRRDRQG